MHCFRAVSINSILISLGTFWLYKKCSFVLFIHRWSSRTVFGSCVGCNHALSVVGSCRSCSYVSCVALANVECVVIRCWSMCSLVFFMLYNRIFYYSHDWTTNVCDQHTVMLLLFLWCHHLSLLITVIALLKHFMSYCDCLLLSLG